MSNSDKQKKQLWYVRRGNAVQGPYPAGLISRYILLGRIHESDEVSRGDNSWVRIADMPELVPEVMQSSMEDAVSRQRLMAAKRWADERTKIDRRHLLNKVDEDRRSDDRRISVVDEAQKRSQTEDMIKEIGEQKRKDRMLVGMIAGSILIAAVATMYLLKPKPPDAVIDCNVMPRAGVNWSNCHKEGAELGGANLIGATMNNMDLGNADLHGSQLVKADLSYSNMSVTNLEDADLREANLVGVNLRQSELANANLKGADLSYADLTGANIRGTLMTGARLGNAIWVDGGECSPDSIGRCRK
jgi:Pentapeptide repeats (8 copies)